MVKVWGRSENIFDFSGDTGGGGTVVGGGSRGQVQREREKWRSTRKREIPEREREWERYREEKRET